MSEDFHSAGEPGATRCSGSATGTQSLFPEGDLERVAVSHECACEIDGLIRLALAVHNTRHDDNPLVLRGLLMRALSLAGTQVSMLGSDSLGIDRMKLAYATVGCAGTHSFDTSREVSR